jgi:hypothetical protein
MPEKPQEIKESIHENGIKETLKNIKNGEELHKTGRRRRRRRRTESTSTNSLEKIYKQQ